MIPNGKTRQYVKRHTSRLVPEVKKCRAVSSLAPVICTNWSISANASALGFLNSAQLLSLGSWLSTGPYALRVSSRYVPC
jgi:hypothetical protein